MPAQDAAFAGRVALVTGARRGIGWRIARRFATLGAHVIINSRAAEPLNAAVAELRADGYQASALPGDICDGELLETGLRELCAGDVVADILVNNVGVRDRRGMREMPTAAFRSLIETDLICVYDLTRAFTSELIARGRTGVIVNVSSVGGIRGFGGDVAYGAAKAALNGLTRSLAAELGSSGFRVNSVAPGPITTETNRYLVDDAAATEFITSRTCLRRWGLPDEVAGVVTFLASDAASYITGQTIAVDGGMSILG